MGNTSKTLEDQINAVFRHTRQGSIKTRERYRESGGRLARFLGERFQSKNMKNLQDKHVEAYVRFLQENNRSVSHIKTELSAIRWIADQVQIKSPLSNAKSFNLRMEIGQRSFVGHDRTWNGRELQIIYQAPDRIRDVLVLARDLGLRIHEAHRIDVAQTRNALRTGVLSVKGKGGLIRNVPLRGESHSVLQSAIERTLPGEKLFVPPDMPTHVAIRGVQDYIRSHRPEDSTASAHGLRHLYARDRYLEFRAQGLSERHAKYQVSELLGHHRAEVTHIYLASLKGLSK